MVCLTSTIENGNLILAIVQHKMIVIMPDTMLNTNSVSGDAPWLSHADSLSGQVSGLRIYVIDKSPMMQLMQYWPSY